MSAKPKFVVGATYRHDEIREHSYPARRRQHVPPDDTLFTYCRDAETGYGFFDEVVENPNPLVDSMQSQIAVERMREHAMTFRQIARASGVSIETVHRASSGVGNVRLSTESALLQVSGALNGKPRNSF